MSDRPDGRQASYRAGLGERLRDKQVGAIRTETERFTSIALPCDHAEVRQMLGRPGEARGAESGLDRLVVVRADG
jgi:streptogramin lyase